MIHFGTSYVLNDEPCLNLAEVNLLTPDYKERHRYEIIYLVRDDDRLYEYRRDMGREENFKADQMRIMGGVIDKGKVYQEETVGSLRDMANWLREHPSFDKNELAKIG